MDFDFEMPFLLYSLFRDGTPRPVCPPTTTHACLPMCSFGTPTYALLPIGLTCPIVKLSIPVIVSSDVSVILFISSPLNVYTMYNLISFRCHNAIGGYMRFCLYARVSKAGEQDPTNQLLELRRWASASGHTILGEYVDEISSRDTRPRKEEVLKMLRTGTADGVCFVALDRWGRSMSELVFEMEEFSKSGKCMVSLKEGLDLSTAAGRMMGNILASMASFERDRIRERTNSGLFRARAQGKVLGRHPVGCGCGLVSEDGKTRHNGPIKPVRDAHNRMAGWLDERAITPRKIAEANPQLVEEPANQTPPVLTAQFNEEAPKSP